MNICNVQTNISEHWRENTSVDVGSCTRRMREKHRYAVGNREVVR